MATNPFEDEDGQYYVLISDEGQHSLWPTFADALPARVVVYFVMALGCIAISTPQ
jgi:MbtH protein